jgi:ATP-binding cassette subfamily B protein
LTTAGGDRLLLRIARHGGGWLALLGTASLAGAGAQVLLPAAIGRTLDAALREGGSTTATHGGAGRWLVYSGLLVAVIVVSAAAVALATGMAGAAATAWLRRLLAGHVLGCGHGLLGGAATGHHGGLTANNRSGLTANNRGGFSAGDVVSRIVGGTADAGAAPGSAVLALTAVIPPAGSVVALGLIDPWLVVAFAAGFPMLTVVLRRLVRDSASVSISYQAALGAISGACSTRWPARARSQPPEQRRPNATAYSCRSPSSVPRATRPGWSRGAPRRRARSSSRRFRSSC